MPEQRTDQTAARSRPRLDRRERGVVALASTAPVLVAAVVLTVIAINGPSGVVDVVIASLVYGGLLGLAAGFVAVDRLQARQCPRCSQRNSTRTSMCADCGYDLQSRPRFACSEHHEIVLHPGLCDCGRRLQQLQTARGIGREIRFILRIGFWVFAFLMLVGVGLALLAR